MKIKYDLHIHSALSPCALEEMSPNNIVNMAILSDLNVIAITDHNSAKNVESVLKVAEDTNLVVIPGIEVESREEIHILCLFPSLNAVLQMQEFIYANLTMLKNKPKVLGNQLLFDADDEIVGIEEQLLSFATKLSFETVLSKTDELGGISIPAHIDRPSYSVISNLGIMPENSLLTSIEISRFADIKSYLTQYLNLRVLQNSDSHELGFIGSCEQYLNLEGVEPSELSPQSIIQFLKRPIGSSDGSEHDS